MIILELPMVYIKNYNEWMEGQEQGIDIEIDEEIQNTCFFLNEKNVGLIRVNSQPETPNKCNLYIDGDSFVIDLDYDSLRLLLKEELKVRETPLTNKTTKENGLESLTFTLNGYWNFGKE